MKYLLRPMELSDIDTVVRQEEIVFGKSLGYDMIYSDLKLNPYAHYMVLEIDEKVEGYIALWINEVNSEIINFYVTEAYQGLGFGKLLLKFAIELVESCKVESLSLEVREKNTKATQLYLSNGFEIGNRRKEYYDDLEDALVMVRRFEV